MLAHINGRIQPHLLSKVETGDEGRAFSINGCWQLDLTSSRPGALLWTMDLDVEDDEGGIGTIKHFIWWLRTDARMKPNYTEEEEEEKETEEEEVEPVEPVVLFGEEL